MVPVALLYLYCVLPVYYYLGVCAGMWAICLHSVARLPDTQLISSSNYVGF